MKRIESWPGLGELNVGGGRIAHRLDMHRVYLICGDCREDVLIQRRDGSVISSADIDEALMTWTHHCGETP